MMKRIIKKAAAVAASVVICLIPCAAGNIIIDNMKYTARSENIKINSYMMSYYLDQEILKYQVSYPDISDVTQDKKKLKEIVKTKVNPEVERVLALNEAIKKEGYKISYLVKAECEEEARIYCRQKGIKNYQKDITQAIYLQRCADLYYCHLYYSFKYSKSDIKNYAREEKNYFKYMTLICEEFPYKNNIEKDEALKYARRCYFAKSESEFKETAADYYFTSNLEKSRALAKKRAEKGYIRNYKYNENDDISLWAEKKESKYASTKMIYQKNKILVYFLISKPDYITDKSITIRMYNTDSLYLAENFYKACNTKNGRVFSDYVKYYTKDYKNENAGYIENVSSSAYYDMDKWLRSDNRKYGDIKLFKYKDRGNYYVIFFIKKGDMVWKNDLINKMRTSDSTDIKNRYIYMYPVKYCGKIKKS